MYGFTGTLLRIDLTAGSIQKEILDPVLAKKYVGGRGLVQRSIQMKPLPA